MPGKCRFNEQWLLNPQYVTWLQRCEFDCYKALCCLCVKSIEVGAMGEAAIKSHMAGKKHARLVEGADLSQLFNNPLISNFHNPTLAIDSVASLCCTTSLDPRIAAALPISLPKRKRTSTIPFSDVEISLLDWFRKHRTQNMMVNGSMLLKKGLELAAGFKHVNYEYIINENWIKLFVKKNGIGVKEVLPVSNESGDTHKTNEKCESANFSEDDSRSNGSLHSEVKLQEMPASINCIKREVVSSPMPQSPEFVGLPSPEAVEENSTVNEHHLESNSIQFNSVPHSQQNGDKPSDQAASETMEMNLQLDFCNRPSDPPRKKVNSMAEMLRMQREEHRLQMVILRQKKLHEQKQHESKMAEHAAAMEVHNLQKEYWTQMLQIASGRHD